MRSYNKLTDVQYNLLNTDGIIDLFGDVDSLMLDYVREALIRARASGDKNGNFPSLKVLISSDGGQITQGLEIVDAFNDYPGHITGVVQSNGKSMAAIILQACDWRQSMENAKILIHNPNIRISWDILRNKKKLAQRIAQLNISRRKLLRILCDRTGRSFREVAAVCAKNKDMTAKEAKAFGLIDEIIKSEVISRKP